MNPRDRYIAALTFGKPDKIPFQPGGPRKSTLDRWHTEGLAEDASWFDAMCEEIGVVQETPSDVPRSDPGVNCLMNPMFEEKVLEHKNGHYIVQDWKGNICEISDEFDVSYLRNAIDFVTRAWLKCPVENRDDWAKMKERYLLDDPIRYPDDFDERVKILEQRDYNTCIALHGPFWQLREWCGFEGLCMMCIEDPDFVHEMAAFWTDFVSKNMARALKAGVVDHIFICEDMAYKEKCMISPAMTRDWVMPAWKQWGEELLASGGSIVEVDSDGNVAELLPLFVEAGVNVNSPIEVAAGNDINEFRDKYGHKIAYCGGVDKRAIAKGGKVIEDEMARIAPVIRDGGFIPSCDHGVPHDISWPNFLHYSRLLAELTGWL